MNKSWMGVLLVAVMAFGGVGCVAQRQYDDLQTLYRRSQEQLVDLQAQLEEANARIRALEEAGASNDPDLMKKLQTAIAERDKLSEELAKSEAALREAALGGGAIMLDPTTNAALQQLAAENPGLMEYDARLGMIKFRSDLTFASGSADVRADAAAALAKLAGILDAPAAEQYEARVVGHTDNVRIARPDTRAKHPTNWHLSVHRAISVKDVLEKAGVPPVRMSVAGYGQYRPVVANGPHGAEANRRVEIYLLPSTAKNLPQGAAEAEPAPAPEAPAHKAAPKEEPPENFK